MVLYCGVQVAPQPVPAPFDAFVTWQSV
jgi:hypothetical protein